MNLLFLFLLLAAPIPSPTYTPNRFLFDTFKIASGLSLIAMIPIAAYQTAIYGTRYLVGANTSNVNHKWDATNPIQAQLAKMDPIELKKMLLNQPQLATANTNQPMMITGNK